MTTGAWWAAALSETVTSVKPLAVAYGGEELVLFRNAEGQPFALEDRCPHRRVPLSLGTVVNAGVQCGYHGWVFDGASGACTQIPNLSSTEKVPARYGARAFPVAELNGFVHVFLGQGEPAGKLPSTDYHHDGREYTGSTIVNMAHADYLATMLDGPHCLLGFDKVQITDFFLGDPRPENGRLVLDRGAVWTSQILPSNFVIDYPLIVRTAIPLAGGTLRIDLLSEDEEPLCTLFIASGANRRGTTSLCWRGYLHANHSVKTPLRWRLGRALKRPPFTVNALIDGAAIAGLLVAPSRELVDVREPVLIPVQVAV